MLDRYELSLPRRVFGGTDPLDRLGAVLDENRAEKLAVFTDKGIGQTGLLDPVLDEIKNSGKKYEYINEPEIKSNDNELKNLATSIFGNEKIILEEE